MKIFNIISRPNIGGLAVYAIHLTQELRRLGHEASLVTGQVSAGEGNMFDLLGEKGRTQTVLIPDLGREISFIKDVRAFWQLWRLFRRERPDVVSTHASKAGVLGRLAAFLAGVPIRVHSYHGTLFHGRYFGWLKTKIFLWIERFFSRLATAIFTDTSSIRAELIAHKIALPSKIFVMPLGTDLTPFQELPIRGVLRKKLGIADNIKCVGIVARLVAIKRLDVFLRAAQHVLSLRRDVHFVIVGGGELEHDLKVLAHELGVAVQVTFLGFYPDLREVYADCDLMVLTSDDEGCPITLIEAMACGKAMVATSVGGVPDVVQDPATGRLAPRADFLAIGRLIHELLESPEIISAMGQRARELAFAKYSILANANQICEVLLQWMVQKGYQVNSSPVAFIQKDVI